MNALDFVKELQKEPETDTYMPSAAEYFQSDVGSKMIQVISDHVTIVDDTSFEMHDNGTVRSFELHPLYRGRRFFLDMEELGFSWEVIGFDEETLIRTYLFKAKSSNDTESKI